jgi:predicted ATPase
LQVRLGIHTGLVVVGEIGSNEKRELLALGETPNLAARIQGLAEPNTVLISAATQRLIEDQFECQPFGSHLVKGIDTPIAVYQVQSERQTIGQLEGKATLTPLVGREQEVGLLFDRWEQVKEGRGQVVLLSGEPGIGKSRLAYTLKEHVVNEGSLFFEARCSPYYQHSALYPLIEVFQRTLLLTRQDTDEEKVQKLERALVLYGMQDTLPLFTALLSLPTPSHYSPLNLTPQKQRERTLQALLQLLMAQAERQATVSVWEDLHWADPSSLEFLSLLIEQIPTSKLLLVLTFRPEFTPPWKPRSHISQLVLNRLGKRQVQEMVKRVVDQALLPSTSSGRTGSEPVKQAVAVRAEPVEARTTLTEELLDTLIARTDGVPLFVEELTKAVIEADGVGARRAVPLQTIPATLQDALMARLDRLSTARQVAQLGATLGREFPYELLHAVAPSNEPELQTALAKLVEAEILYQRGVGQQARYFFKHALIQDTAYQSLLKSTRQLYHQQIARVLEEQFPGAKERQPELLAHHYTEANLIEQAIPYWQQAGQKAVERSANKEAISHLTKGLGVLKTLSDTPERAQQELLLQIALGAPLIATKGWAAPETERTYTRTRELCQQVGETPQLFPALWGLYQVYMTQAEYQMAHELAEQLFTLAQRQQDQTLLLVAHYALGMILYYLGEFTQAREHLEQGLALYDPPRHHSLAFLYGQDFRVSCLFWTAFALWHMGYPDQALKKSNEALTLAQDSTHPFSLAIASASTVIVHQLRREEHAAQEQATALIALCSEQGILFFLAWGIIWQGWALAAQGQKEEIARIRQGLTASQATGAKNWRSQFLALLAEASGRGGQIEEGLVVLTEALAQVDKTEERYYEAELYRLRGELTLAHEGKRQKSKGKSQNSRVETNPQSLTPDPQGEVEREVEGYFLKAIEIARKQQAKSLELRAVMSLVRLRQQQAALPESHITQHETRTNLDTARTMLADVYNWFTEGFDTKDLQEAQALLESLSP